MESWKLELYHAVPIGSIPEEDRKYGIPEQKKFPMFDKQHVISAIKFFNYVEPRYEKQLAKAILARMKEYGMSFDDFGVGEDNRFSKYIPEKYLVHHGILGQKWGVIRYQNKDGSLTKVGKKRRKEHPPISGKTLNKDLDEKIILTTKNKDGSDITIEQLQRGKLAKCIANGIRYKETRMKRYLNNADFDIKVNENRVGEMQLSQISDDEINGVWLGIDDEYQGNGYATASLMKALNYSKQRGYKTFSLEVPGNSPDARHIYEKLGFKDKGLINDPDKDFVWNGLTRMELDLTKYDL